MKSFDFISDSVKCDLQGYSNFRKCIEAKEKIVLLSSPYSYCGKDKVKLYFYNTKCHNNSV
jgi:hypothetical protein